MGHYFKTDIGPVWHVPLNKLVSTSLKRSIQVLSNVFLFLKTKVMLIIARHSHKNVIIDLFSLRWQDFQCRNLGYKTTTTTTPHHHTDFMIHIELTIANYYVWMFFVFFPFTNRENLWLFMVVYGLLGHKRQFIVLVHGSLFAYYVCSREDTWKGEKGCFVYVCVCCRTQQERT